MLEQGAHWDYVIAAWSLGGAVLLLLFARALLSRAAARRRWTELEALKPGRGETPE